MMMQDARSVEWPLGGSQDEGECEDSTMPYTISIVSLCIDSSSRQHSGQDMSFGGCGPKRRGM
jgi:hypothetical protein